MPAEVRVTWPIPLVLLCVTLAGAVGFIYR